ncbi:hypothetical protein [Hymenobacter wooponensis]|uniref:Uncharacterized protein n=1 Tax=Hymenobacter wooponensis TaxID=1525360 RepID=A0A4Z0MU77_9BACT|nr:hypothetical protein [Hymenobacter wooponensis]TGD82868.1 hypothetical protein EU557_03550 [Hymenobacter wooponensis]
MSNQLLVGGIALDLSPDTVILPSFQANDLTKPDTIQSDFSPEFSLPGTQKNHQLLGRAAYGGTLAGIPYRKLMATLLSDGVEIMPLALLIVKGYAGGKYQVQLFAGNRRFIEQLGDKTLQELDFSRFNHLWTLDNVASRLPLAYWQEHGWGYEVLDRGRPLDLTALNPFICLPSVSAQLIWDQMLAEAEFTATDLSQEPLFSRLNVPSPQVAGYPADFIAARQLVAGHPQQPIVPRRQAATRDPLEFQVPFTFHPAGTDPFHTPTIPGMLIERTFSEHGETYPFTIYVPDTACLLTIEARVNVDFEVRLGKVRARLSLYKNGLLWVEGTAQEVGTGSNHLVSASVTATREPVAAGDEIYCVLRLESVSLVSARWGFYTGLFSGQQYGPFDMPSPLDQWKIEVVSEVPPGGQINLAAWLPDMKQLDFFKTIVQLLGLTVQTDAYDSHLHLGLSGTVLDNAPKALDWTGKRDAPFLPAGEARDVVFRFGSYGRKNWLRWTTDSVDSYDVTEASSRVGKVIPKGYADGYLAVADENLPAEASLGTLPFAATGNSQALPGGLKIPNWKRNESGGTITYDQQDVVPRLTLRTGAPLQVVLRYLLGTRTVSTVLSYFADATAQVELDLQRCILPRYWRGLAAMLLEARYHKERYRLTQQDIAALDYTMPIWDGVLGDYFAISQVAEFSADRPTEVALCRLHPSLLAPPVSATQPAIGLEFFEGEFNVTATTPPEFY